jgi:hypothetical protein
MTDTPTPTAPETAILPCPFCGEPPLVCEFPGGDGSIDITCETVNCPASHVSSGDAMVDPLVPFNAWNRRAPPPELATLRASEARMREALVANARVKLSELTAWLEQDEDNPTLLLAALTDEQLAQVRAIFTRAALQGDQT